MQPGVLYQSYQTQADILLPLRAMARTAQAAFGWVNGDPSHALFRRWTATLEMAQRFALSHERPDYGIREVPSGGRMVPVVEEIVAEAPFGTLLRFRKDMEEPQPRVLIVAPLSGHFATLLRNTVETMLRDHDVYITDWRNARDVPMEAGPFGFADYVDQIISFFEAIAPGAHLLSVCQPCVPAFAAVALMAADKHPCQPKTMTLMGGPIDVRQSPTTVNALAFDHPIEWFEQNLIATVPFRYRGAGRRVYPGFVQLNAFMQMNMDRHVNAHRKLYMHLANNEIAEAETIKKFYDEYFAVLDMPAEFYLETVRMVFQEALMAKGELMHRGRLVDPGKIRRTALLTVEGERDDVCALGQTAAAHELCKGLR
ncbi:MAG: polyhydroxyalkanoate depolymerase, partial [Hyphomonadaceae bacterium]